MSGTGEETEEVGGGGVRVLTTGAGGRPVPTTGGGGLPSPVPTTPGETIAAGAGATRPGGGNILHADTESGSGLTSKPTNVINLNAAQCCFQPDQIIVLL